MFVSNLNYLTMKRILFSLLLTSFVIAAQAQFGVHAGINVSSLRGEDMSGFKSKLGAHFGVSYQIPVSNGIAVQTEATYSSEGAKYTGGGDGDYDVKYNFNYLNLAALFRYNFEGGFNLATGPQYGFITSAKLKSEGESMDFKDELKSGNFSWAFAAGYDLPMGFGLYARYNLGLSSIEKESEGEHVKASTFQFGVRYSIKTGSKK